MSTVQFSGFLLRQGPLEVEYTEGVMTLRSACIFVTPNPQPGIVEAIAQSDMIACTFTVNEAKHNVAQFPTHQVES